MFSTRKSMLREWIHLLYVMEDGNVDRSVRLAERLARKDRRSTGVVLYGAYIDDVDDVEDPWSEAKATVRAILYDGLTPQRWVRLSALMALTKVVVDGE